MEVDTLAIEKGSASHRKAKIFLFILGISVFGVILAYRILSVAPSEFPLNTPITIDEGSTVNEVTEILAQKDVVHSALYLYITLLYYYENTYVQAGTYSFNTPLTVSEVAHAITTGQYRSPLVSITLPEGFRARDMSTYGNGGFSINSSDIFIPYEGHLFPDTYFISTNTTPEELLTLLTKTSEERLAPYAKDIENSGFTKDQILVLASIIEREAKDTLSKKMVSGILQNRLSTGMPLQVDATFDYILNKESAELTVEDLATDSPYNTYTHIGLPPTPIANPGIESIEAVLYPEKSDFMYYLTAPDGVFHYAKTFEEHKKNKELFLP